MRVLLTGWASFRHGEATAGDVLSLRAAARALAAAGIGHAIAWSPGFRPGALHLADAPPESFSHLVFVCGPVHGPQVRELHERYARCRRIAVGVSIPDPRDPAATGFHRLLPRDDGKTAEPDLSLGAPAGRVPVAGVVLAPGQPEYGGAGRHDRVHGELTTWLAGQDCARVPLDSRLAHGDWTHCATPDQFLSVLSTLDVLVTTRLHGLVFGLRARVPVLAVDPVAGGGKVTAQAAALGWPALVPAEDAGPEAFDRWLKWCLSGEGRERAAAPLPEPPGPAALVDELAGRR